jgi:3-deoxy-D-manno-octulosonate 8-phosphate phosphatase (KDO 8-P phosphatase)
MKPEQLEQLFAAAGGEMIASPGDFSERSRRLAGMVFDWDGVFNRGRKAPGHASGFSEADSMGTNLLRYGLWRQKRRLPVAAIISGEDNPAARHFAQREHFQAVYFRVLDKQAAVDHLCAAHDLTADRLLCVFDDVNDLSMARACGLRCWVRRPVTPLLLTYIKKRGLADYITAASSGLQPVREVAELILGMADCFDAVLDSRMALDEVYRKYLAQRQALPTRFYRQEENRIVTAD